MWSPAHWSIIRMRTTVIRVMWVCWGCVHRAVIGNGKKSLIRPHTVLEKALLTLLIRDNTRQDEAPSGNFFVFSFSLLSWCVNLTATPQGAPSCLAKVERTHILQQRLLACIFINSNRKSVGCCVCCCGASIFSLDLPRLWQRGMEELWGHWPPITRTQRRGHFFHFIYFNI